MKNNDDLFSLGDNAISEDADKWKPLKYIKNTQKVVIFRFEVFSGAMQKDLSLGGNNNIFLINILPLITNKLVQCKGVFLDSLRMAMLVTLSLRCNKNEAIL